MSALVIGLPLNMDGTEGPRAQSCRAFARNLERIRPVPVAFWDERLSTSAVERFLIEDLDLNRKRRAEVVDRTAAAWILQGALDRVRDQATWIWMGGLILGVLPVFCLIAIGYGLRKSDFLPDATWRPIEKLSIHLLYPGFLIPAIWNADISGGGAGAAGAAAVTTVIDHRDRHPAGQAVHDRSTARPSPASSRA